MGETSNKVMGKTKKAVGRATGDRDLEGRGKLQETAGKAQGGLRKAGRAVSRGIDKVADKAGEAKARRGARPKATGTARPATRRKTTTVEEEY